MKKELLFFVMILFVFSFITGAQDFSITVDGEKDAFYETLTGPDDGYLQIRSYAWNNNGVPDNDNDLSAKIWTAWDDSCFYIYEEVKDDTISMSGNATWKNDCIELKFDPQATDSTTNSIVGLQMTVYDTTGGQAGAADFPGKFFRKTTADGYVLEAAIPWSSIKWVNYTMTVSEEVDVKVGSVFGFAVQNHDNDNTIGIRDATVQWSAVLLDAVWNTTKYLGTVRFLNENKLQFIPTNNMTGVTNPIPYDGSDYDRPSPVKANFSGLPRLGIVPLSVQFTNYSFGIIDSYLWDFGDGTTSTLTNPLHIYQDEGVYTVSLTVSRPDIQDNLTWYNYITVIPEPDTLKVPKISYAPVIDGKLDPIWEIIPNTHMEKYILEAPDDSLDLSGSFRLAWDNDNLYIFVSIVDDLIRFYSEISYGSDGIELFFDGDNSKTGIYDGINDIYLMINYNSSTYEDINVSYGSGSSWGFNASGIDFAKVNTEHGWNLEISIPLQDLKINAENNHVFGFDIHYNDNDTGWREHILKWWTYSDYTYYNPALMGTARLSSGIILGIPVVNTFPKDTLLIPINAQIPSDIVISSAEITVKGYFNSLNFIDIVTVTDTATSLIGAADWTYEINETDTALYLAMYGSEDISCGGTLCWLKYVVPNTATTGFIPITLKYAVFNTGEIPVDFSSGGVTINFYFGDVDLNGKIQAYDASQILKYLVDYIDLDRTQLFNAEVSGNDTLTAYDASLIAQYIVHLIDMFPVDTGSFSAHASGSIAMSDGSINPGDIVEIPLLLSNGSNILSFEGSIAFNPQHLTFNNLIWSKLVDGFTIETNADSGVIKFAGAGSASDGGEGVFTTLKFTAKENFSESETAVILKTLRWNEEPVMKDVASAVLTNTVGINEDHSNIPKEYALQQNFPNPFNPTTTISFQIPKSSFVKLNIYDVNGRLIETLVNENKNAGYYSISWSSEDIVSGLYFYRIDAGEFTCVKKCLIVK